jgi:beta-lactamase class A
MKFFVSKLLSTGLLIILVLASFFTGWFAKGKFFSNPAKYAAKENPSLRLGGYKFINPLLLCDPASDQNNESPKMNLLKNKLSDFVNQKKKENAVQNISIFLRDLKSGDEININADEKFHPASLNKIPLLIAYLKYAETNPDILSQKITITAGTDENSQQEIAPQDYAKANETYSIEELLEKMIKFSDNNSFYTLLNNFDVNTLQSVYQDLQVPFYADPTNNTNDPQSKDYMTTEKFSYFFRILYNGTYLHKDSSEKALELLAQTDFSKGLAAGIPQNNIPIAHKFGLVTQKIDNALIVARELHDCGIIYHPQNPYLLCVMTKSQSEIPDIEDIIKNISSIAYQEVNNNYQ